MNLKDVPELDWIPWAKPKFWGLEKQFVESALDSQWISGGPYVDQLESEMAKYLGSPTVLAVSNGTAALHLAYLGLNLVSGDEIIVPGFAFMAAANIAILCGMKVIFADVNPETWCIDPESFRKKITPKTRAVVAVHTYGNMCEMDAINEIAKRHNISVIEDAAESFGSTFKGRQAGTMGTVGTFSFHATKTITTGEGGLVCTSDSAILERMILFRSHGMLRKKHYWHDAHGHNFRLTNMQAALGCAQLKYVNEIQTQRHSICVKYNFLLNGSDGLKIQRIPEEVNPLMWAYAIQLSPKFFPQGRDRVMEEMRLRGIETRPGFVAPTEMKIYSANDIQASENLANSILVLPTYPGLTELQIERICAAILKSRI